MQGLFLSLVLKQPKLGDMFTHRNFTKSIKLSMAYVWDQTFVWDFFAKSNNTNLYQQ